MKDELAKKFTLPIPVMLDMGQRFLDQFSLNPTDFTTDYFAFKTPFETNMQDAIDLCLATDSDEKCVAKQAEQTAIVEAIMETSRKKYQAGELVVKQIWPDNIMKLKLFGHSGFEDARNSHVKLPGLLMQAYDMASDVDNKPKFIAGGFTLLKIEALKTNADQLILAVRKQNSFKGARTITTQERTKNLNALWDMMVLLSECAKVIYEENPAMWNLYLLYPDVHPTPPIPDPVPPTA